MYSDLEFHIFVTGQWSPCFLDSDQGSCGHGVHFRNVYCVSSLDQVVSDRRCPDKPKPDNRETCRIPCPQQCTVSEWTDWGECSRSCGAMGGVQTRTRRITGKVYYVGPVMVIENKK